MATRSTDKPAGIRHTARAVPRRRAAAPLGGPALDPALAAELGGSPWEQSWELTPAIHTPIADPDARQRHWTLGEMLRPFARDAFVLSADPCALDLHCGEGWIAQRLLDWGARRVLAVDDRPGMLERAALLREHFAIGAAQLSFLAADRWAPPTREARFDVVVLTGAVERAGEEEALARARAATRSICAIECAGSEANAVAEAALAAGFSSLLRVRPPLQGAPLYVTEQRNLLIAKVAIGG